MTLRLIRSAHQWEPHPVTDTAGRIFSWVFRCPACGEPGYALMSSLADAFEEAGRGQAPVRPANFSPAPDTAGTEAGSGTEAGGRTGQVRAGEGVTPSSPPPPAAGDCGPEVA